MPRLVVGNRLMRYAAVWKAYGQKLGEREALLRRQHAVSVRCRRLLSERPLCSGVWGGVVRW